MALPSHLLFPSLHLLQGRLPSPWQRGQHYSRVDGACPISTTMIPSSLHCSTSFWIRAVGPGQSSLQVCLLLGNTELYSYKRMGKGKFQTCLITKGI